MRYGLTVRHKPTGKTIDTEVSDFLKLKNGRCLSYTQYVDTSLVYGLTQG